MFFTLIKGVGVKVILRLSHSDIKRVRGFPEKETQFLLTLFKYHFSQSFINFYRLIKAAMSLTFRECSMNHVKLPPRKIFKFQF